jgi:hypothetical protein
MTKLADMRSIAKVLRISADKRRFFVGGDSRIGWYFLWAKEKPLFL